MEATTERRPWSLWAPPLAFGCAFVLSSIVTAILLVATGSTGDEDPPPGVLLGGNTVSQIALVAFAIFFTWVFSGRPTPADFGIKPPPDVRQAIGWTIAALAAFYVLSAVYAAALGIDEQEDLPQQLGADDSTAARVAVVFFAVLAAPLVEEFFFRGFLFETLRRRAGLVVGVLVTGLLFGGAHAFGSKPEFLVPLALFGAILCLLYWKTGSLYPCVAVHLFNNAVAIVVSLEWPAIALPGLLLGGALLAGLVLYAGSRVSARSEPSTTFIPPRA